MIYRYDFGFSDKVLSKNPVEEFRFRPSELFSILRQFFRKAFAKEQYWSDVLNNR